MDQRLEQELRKAGWYPGRDVFAEVMLDDDFKLNPKAIEILAEFGNLNIGYEPKKWAADVLVDPGSAGLNSAHMEILEQKLKKTLYPIGAAYSANSGIFADEDGKIYDYCHIAGGVTHLADSFLDALLVIRGLSCTFERQKGGVLARLERV